MEGYVVDMRNIVGSMLLFFLVLCTGCGRGLEKTSWVGNYWQNRSELESLADVTLSPRKIISFRNDSFSVCEIGISGECQKSVSFWNMEGPNILVEQDSFLVEIMTHLADSFSYVIPSTQELIEFNRLERFYYGQMADSILLSLNGHIFEINDVLYEFGINNQLYFISERPSFKASSWKYFIFENEFFIALGSNSIIGQVRHFDNSMIKLKIYGYDDVDMLVKMRKNNKAKKSFIGYWEEIVSEKEKNLFKLEDEFETNDALSFFDENIVVEDYNRKDTFSYNVNYLKSHISLVKEGRINSIWIVESASADTLKLLRPLRGQNKGHKSIFIRSTKNQ